MKTVKVLQIRKDVPDRYWKVFEPYERLIKHFGKVNIDEYECVFECLATDSTRLDDIFAMCNLNHPPGYKGHSLSVSDIVVLDGKHFYCNDIGWKELMVCK